jgi:hypothetical protein
MIAPQLAGGGVDGSGSSVTVRKKKTSSLEALLY